MVTRKQFIESIGATCKNWYWSWSFINEKEKIIIFGAWDNLVDGKKSIILDERWVITDKGRKAPGYTQSHEHIRLVEERGYQLSTFPIEFSYENKDVDGKGPAKIAGFTPKATPKKLIKEGVCWYAC